MTGSILLWGGLALLVFWCVGLYNRLMRIRARGLDALGSVDKHIKGYAATVQGHLEAMRHSELATKDPEGNAPLPAGWAHLVAELGKLEAISKAARATPLAIGPMEALTHQLEVVDLAWAMLCDEPADLAGPTVPAALAIEWEAVSQRVHIARGGYNQIVARYNEAIGQLPARVVVGTMGFQPAGTL
ncbi:MAG: LemA family protein [Burkholderiales bacterium]|nr:LemA family protein [Burkholderiales bacterium]